MKLTAVIPTIGRLPFLDFSIGSLLAQRIPFDEILIVDNSSDQNLQQLSRWGRMTGVRWERSGGGLPATQNWNLAVRLCSYEYVTIFGDDDIARENFCDELRTGLRNSGMVFCNFDVIDEHGDIVRRGKTLPMQFTAAQFRHARMRGELYTVIPGFAFRQKDFIDIGGFRHLGLPKDLYCDDDLWFRLSERAGSLTVARGTSWCYRIHDGQVGHVFSYRTFLQNIDEFVKLMMEALKELGVVEKDLFPKDWNKDTYRRKLLDIRLSITLSRDVSAGIRTPLRVAQFDAPWSERGRMFLIACASVLRRLRKKMERRERGP